MMMVEADEDAWGLGFLMGFMSHVKVQSLLRVNYKG